MAETQTKRDGKRLEKALEALGISQREAARRCGTSQSHMNDFIKGRRAIPRETLGKLRKIGVPVEYVLGFTDKFIPAGQTQTVSALESDIAAHVANAIDWTIISGDHEVVRSSIDGKALLDTITRDAVAEIGERDRAPRELEEIIDYVVAVRTPGLTIAEVRGLTKRFRDVLNRLPE